MVERYEVRSPEDLSRTMKTEKMFAPKKQRSV
jgi:hypothetical protein